MGRLLNMDCAQLTQVIPVLPWLLVSNTQLSQANLVDLAGKCGLQCLLEMQLEPCKGGLAMVRSCWRNTSVDAFVAAVGALHRLMRRYGPSHTYREVIGHAWSYQFIHLMSDAGLLLLSFFTNTMRTSILAAYCIWPGPKYFIKHLLLHFKSHITLCTVSNVGAGSQNCSAKFLRYLFVLAMQT